MKETSTPATFASPLVAILLALVVLLSGFYFAQRSGTDPKTYKNDFNVYYFAAGEIRDARSPYDRSLGDWTPYLYPPLLAEIIVPLSLLPLPVAAYLWFLLSAMAVFVVVQLSMRLVIYRGENGEGKLSATAIPALESEGAIGSLPLKTEARTWISVITLLVFLRFILDNFDYGQVNPVVAALCVAHLYFYTRNRKLVSACALILAISIKITPVIFILFHLIKGRLKFASFSVLLLTAVTVLSFAPFGGRAPEAFNTFVNRTIKNEQGFNFAYHGNQSLRAAIERLSGNNEATDPSSPVTAIIGLGFLALACYVAFRAKTEINSAAPFFCCTVLLSPLSWKQHFVILILPVAFLAGELLCEERPIGKKVFLAILLLTFALFNLTSPKLIGVVAAEWCDAHSLVFSGGLLIFLAISAISLKRPRSD
jgi:hypothetical protein